MSDIFTFPWQYDFPPFFTIQPNLSTREKQLEIWTGLVIDYCQKKKIYTLDVVEAGNSELFFNKAINRKLNSDGLRTILSHLDSKGHLEWLDKSNRRCRVIWRTTEEWAKLIYNWAKENGFTGTVHTFHELTDDEETAAESFHGLETELLVKALRYLESQGKAELIGDNEGVKFF